MGNITLTAVFNTPGAFTWQPPPGVTSATVVAWGGGGAGGDAGTTSGSTGGGAGAGECACEPALGVTPGITYSGVIGAGGLGSASGVQGGQDTSFTGDGGVVVYAHGGGGGSTSPTGGSGAGLGGTGSSNTLVGAGGNGDNGASAGLNGWSLVQESAAQNNTGTNTLPSPSTQGNLLIAVVGSASNTPITAPAGWASGLSAVNGTVNEIYIFAYFNNPGGLSSFTFGGGGVNILTIAEFTGQGVSSVSAANGFGTNTAGAVGSVAVTTSGSALAGDLVITAGFEHLTASSPITWTDPTGFTQFTGLLVGNTANHAYAGYDLSENTSGAQTVTMTSSVPSTLATGWTGAVATFTLPSAGGGGGGAGGVTAVADSRLPLIYPAQGWPGNNGNGSTAGAASPGTYPGGAGGTGSTSGAGTGGNGVAPGGGGGGSVSTGTGRNGGNGANGQVTITWTMADPVTISTNTVGGTYSYQSPIGGSAVLAQAWGAGAGGFNVTGGSSGNNGLVGGTLPPSAFRTGAYDAGLNQEQADSFFVQLTGRGNGTHLTVTKKFWNLSDWSTSKNNLTNYVAHGTKVLFALKPAFNPGSTSGPHGGNGTSADVTNLSNFLKAIALMGYTSKNCEIIFWQEPANSQNVNNPTDYGLIIKSYGPTVNNSVAADGQPFKLVVNVNYVGGGSVNNATDYANAALGLRGFVSTGTTISAIAMDFYTNSYMNQGTGTIKKLLDTQDSNGDSISGIADANGLPFGLNEFGAQPTDYTQAQCTQYFNYLISFFTARLSAGKTNWNMIYYDGEGSPTGVGDITSPLSQDPSTGTQIGSTPVPSYNDYRVALYQQLYDALTAPVVSAPGGAGGGGGEFASEAALALNDSAIYTFAIGAGNPLQSGGNTTIAGQSVTVTAHGGSVATLTTAGGVGGTGSANTTHHDGGAGGAGGGATGGGGGGGGSGGTAATGNAGHAGTSIAGGNGGAAVTNGGAGGKGGAPSNPGNNGATPGGAGGGSGANNTGQGDGSDGQIVLSGFVTHPAGIAAFQLGGLSWAASGSVVSPGNWALAPIAFSATGKVGMINFVQQGPASTGPFTLNAPSTAGNLLLAVVVQSTQSLSTPPAGVGWSLVQAQNTSGASGRIELWYLNDLVGGTSSVTWTGGTALRGNLYEFSPPPGYIAQLDGTPVSTGFGAGTTSFGPINMTLPNATDLLFSCFEDQFSSSPAGSTWTRPSGWTQGISIAQGVVDEFTGYYKLGVSASGTQGVTGTFSTSTNQVGAAGIIAGFTAIPTVGGSSGQLALGPLSWGGSASTSSPGVTTNGVWGLGGLSWQSPSEAVTFPQDPLPIRVEILINGAWADISNYVYQRDGISIIGRGRPDEASTAQPTQMSLTLDARDGSFNPYNTSGQFYPFLTRNTQIRLSVINAVTPQGAWYNGTRFIGEVPSWPPSWDPTQTDVYVQVQAVGVLQRMRQSKFLASPLKRYYSNLTGALIPAAYWPTEDGTVATNFASGIPGGSEMFFTGTPNFASDTNVPGSAAFAQLASSVWTGIPGAFSAGGQTFNTPGTFQWLCPSGINTIQVQCVGGGGGGQDGANSSGNGGGGGEFAQESNLAVTPGKTYTLVVGAGGSGGAGAFAPPNHSAANNGSNGQNSTFTGDSVTVIAHGGKGATNSGGNGGSGSSNSIHHNGGNGANSGSGFGGGGGGGSGGSSGSGNNGHNNSGTTGGAGATAVAGGGPGGTGGNGATAAQGNIGTPGMMPTAGPGGGGGAGGFNSADNYDKPGGNGFAGQVQIIFGLTQVPAPPAIALRIVVDTPQGGGIDGSVMGEIDCATTGTLATMQIIYRTANSGSFQLKATKTAGGGTLFDSGTVAFGNNGKPVMVSGELTATPSGTSVSWKLTGIYPGATGVVVTKTGTYNGNLAGVTEFRSNNGTLDTGDTGVGHIAVQYAIDPILNLSQAFNGYIGELAATRFIRLCGEQQVPVVLFGSVTDTPQMGAQPVDILVNLLQDCENVDLGMMFERRAIFGLAYVTRANMQNQNPDCVLDYSLNQIVLPLQPTDDDALTRNDIIATRGTAFATGSSFELQDTSGPMSINDPPNGVGLYQYSVTVNLFADTQLPNFAAWLLTLGTVDEFRYPIITIDMTRIQVSDGTFQSVAGLDIGAFLQIINVPSFLQNPINQLCFGFAEVMNAFEWTISINAVPEDPWTGTNLPSW